MTTVPIPHSATEVPALFRNTMINAYVQFRRPNGLFLGLPIVNARAGTRSRLYSPLE